mmetsp:Transcript_35571/g.89309  ORF Transcript_35571/g.89309 Transcript_35571/m.89309 type:complete len:239 (-) Transcript_35571:1065-1781(-)
MTSLRVAAVLELCHQGDVVAAEVGAGQAASRRMLFEVRIIWQLQQTHGHQRVCGVEDVVQGALEVAPNVGELGLKKVVVHAPLLPGDLGPIVCRIAIRAVRAGEAQLVRELGCRLVDAQGVVLEIRVAAVHILIYQQLVSRAAGGAVEVARHKHGDIRTGRNLLEAFQQRMHLPQLDVTELRVGMDVGVGHADELTCVGPRLRRLNGFQHSNQRHVVLEETAKGSLLLVVDLQRLGER